MAHWPQGPVALAEELPHLKAMIRAAAEDAWERQEASEYEQEL